jgi:Na+/melibiose symporter-like transporter
VATFYLAAQLVPRAVFILIACPMVRVCGARLTILTSFVLTWLNSAVGIYVGTYVTYDAMMATLLLESVLIVFQDAYVMIYAEVIDDDMRRHKRKAPVSTVLFTITTLFLQPSTALAPMIIVRALNIGDYDVYKESIRVAPPYTKYVMLMVANCVPAAAALLSFISLFFYKNPNQEHRPLVQPQKVKELEPAP